MKTIKVIDFLIKKANKEDLPKKVKFHNEIFIASNEYDGEHVNQEEDSDGSRRCLFEGWILGEILNDSVEIIEEDKEIRPLPTYKYEDEVLKIDLARKIDDLVKVVNTLKKGK